MVYEIDKYGGGVPASVPIRILESALTFDAARKRAVSIIISI